MRLFTLMLVACCFLFCKNGVSQTINFSGKEVPLQKVFTEIEKQTGYLVVCNSKLITEAKPVTLTVKGMPLKNFLEVLFKDRAMEYFIENQTITVKRKVPETTRLTEAMAAMPVLPEERTISAVVTDSLGHPLPGVSVRLVGKTRGTYTDQSGRFTIKADSAAQLGISCMGFQPRTISVAATPVINAIALRQSVNMMGEVAVIATGYQQRNSFQMIGSVSTVTAKDLETAGTVTVDKAIAGKIPGVYVRSTSGKPGEIGEIRIRGINTLSGDKEPLYVLDGMPLQSSEGGGTNVSRIFSTGIGNIPPEDIETITILKDATAAAIYGARAANGVVVITTKMGTVGKDYVTYTGKVSLTEPPKNKYDFMNSAEKVAFEKQLYSDYHPAYGGRVVQLLNQADNGSISPQNAAQQMAALAQTNTDWMKELYNTGLSHSHNLSMSGGNLKTQYYASVNYTSNEGTLLNNKYQSGGMNLKLQHFINSQLLLRFNLYTTLKNNKYTSSLADPFKYAAFANTYEKPYNADGSYAADLSYLDLSNNLGSSATLNYGNFNIIREVKENTLTSMYGDARGQIDIEYNFLKHFRFISTGNLEYSSIHNTNESYPGTWTSYYSNWVKGGYGGALLDQYNRGFLKEDMSRTLNYTIRNSLEYNNTIADKHFIQAYLAQDISGTKSLGFNHFDPIYEPEYRLAGYPTWGDINSNPTGDMVYAKYNLLKLNSLGGTAYRENRTASFISSLVYSYDNRFVFNGNWRMDGVDIIGTDNRFTPLWSAGFKWNMMNENFMKPYQDIITRLVPTIGYGYRGSINRSVYPFHVYSLGTNNYDGIPAATTISYGNPVLKWEKKKELNAGLELSLFKGRFNFEGRYYNEDVTDLLDEVQLPASIGRQQTTTNVGSLTNKGWDLSTRIEIVKSKNWRVEAGGNITLVTNRLNKVYNNMTPNIAQNVAANVQGYAVNSWYGYKFDHVDPNNGHTIVWAQRVQPGGTDGKTIAYKDELVDINTATLDDLQANYRTYYLGHIDPNLFGGMNLTVNYRNFEFATQFTYAGGNTILNFQDRLNGPSTQNTGSGSYVTDDITASRTNRVKETAYRWRQVGDVTDIPGFSPNVANYFFYLQDKDLGDGSYLRCSQMALSWRAAGRKLRKTALDNMRVTLEINNPFLVTGYEGADPETQAAFAYPNTRSYTLSVTLGF